MYLVNDVYFIALLGRGKANVFAEFSYFIDAPVGGGVDLEYIKGSSLQYPPAGLATVTGLASLKVKAVYRPGQKFCGTGFPCPPGTAKKIGMGDHITN